MSIQFLGAILKTMVMNIPIMMTYHHHHHHYQDDHDQEDHHNHFHDQDVHDQDDHDHHQQRVRPDLMISVKLGMTIGPGLRNMKDSASY